MAEVWSDPKALWKLNQKIIKEGVIFWAYTKEFSWCQECGMTINTKIDECPVCGSNEILQYSRITGYYLPTNGWNNGKIAELRDRYGQKIND